MFFKTIAISISKFLLYILLCF